MRANHSSLTYLRSRRALETMDPVCLSICLPTWDRLHLLKKQVRAIAECLDDTTELIIFDNCSDDGTWEFLGGFVENASTRIRCFRNPCNLGAEVNFLKALEASLGEWCWLIGDDDPFDFSHLPAFQQVLQRERPALLGLIAQADGKGFTRSMLSEEEFFSPRNIHLDHLFMQAGSIIASRQSILENLRFAYQNGIGSLHAHSFLFGPTLKNAGLMILVGPLFVPGSHTDIPPAMPRWSLLGGHLGAWQAALAIFGPARKDIVHARQRRLRQNTVVQLVIGNLYYGRTPLQGQHETVLALVGPAGKIKILSMFLAFKINRPLAEMLVARFFRKAVVLSCDPSAVSY